MLLLSPFNHGNCKIIFPYVHISIHQSSNPKCLFRGNIIIWVFPKIGVKPPKWMVYKGKTLLELMIWGAHPYFWKHHIILDWANWSTPWGRQTLRTFSLTSTLALTVGITPWSFHPSPTQTGKPYLTAGNAHGIWTCNTSENIVGDDFFYLLLSCIAFEMIRKQCWLDCHWKPLLDQMGKASKTKRMAFTNLSNLNTGEIMLIFKNLHQLGWSKHCNSCDIHRIFTTSTHRSVSINFSLTCLKITSNPVSHYIHGQDTCGSWSIKKTRAVHLFCIYISGSTFINRSNWPKVYTRITSLTSPGLDPWVGGLGPGGFKDVMEKCEMILVGKKNRSKYGDRKVERKSCI